jgi:hypothetical protein
MQKIFVLYVGKQPKHYSYEGEFARQLAKELSKKGEQVRLVTKPEMWIQTHQHVGLIQSGDAGAANSEKVIFQKRQVTRQKIYSLFGQNVPVGISKTNGVKSVQFGHGSETISVQLDETMRVTTTKEKRLLNMVIRQHSLSYTQGHEAIKELAVWIGNEWDTLNLLETPW